MSSQLKAESFGALAEAARRNGNAVRGAILFTHQSLNCTGCHTPGAISPVGPDLMQLAPDVTDVYLVEAMLEPSKAIKKGFESVTVVTTAGKSYTGRIVEQQKDRVVLHVTSGDLQRVTLPRLEIEEIAPSQLSAMPDNLVDQLASRDQFLDLVRYLMELAAADRTRTVRAHAAGGKMIDPELQGIVLLKEFNCAACHRDDVAETLVAENQAPDLLRSAGWINPHFVQQFLADPLTVKPGTRMPDVMSGLAVNERRAAAEEIAHYLAALGERRFTFQAVDAEAAARGRDVFHTVGCTACHSPRDDQGRESLPESSVPLGDMRHKYNLDGLVPFLKNPLEVRASGRMPKMNLTHWEAIDVASYLLSSPHDDLVSEPFTPDQALAAKGKARFNELNCRQCHRMDSADAITTSLPLSQVRPERGCLSPERGQWPAFDFSAAQRDAITLALRRERTELSQQDQIAVTLTSFRCLNCHQRDELGGVSSERDVHFKTSDPNLGPQGRIPPPLTGVGAKLNPEWMRQVLVSGRTIRPYILTRMPQYGTENVAHLVDLFPQVDQLASVEYAAFADQKEMRKTGAEMVGTGGLNCIVCHTFQLQKAANMSAVDLTEMAQRLQKDWFYHYMRDPQSLSQNTIMPSFWPGGRAMRVDILDGNRDLQIEALWQYLLDGRQAPTPRGLIQEPLELLATDETVMLRRSYPGIGKRGIGVGYPNQVNLAFDAEQMRLAMIWQGPFANPAGVWRSQGHGMVRPLGHRLIEFAPGPDLDDPESPWIVNDGRPPDHQFKGYSLDEKMRPKFRYQFAEVVVDDYSIDVFDSSTERPFLRRTVSLQSLSGSRKLAFRAATGSKIEHASDGSFVVDGKLTVRIDDQHTGVVVETPEGKLLRIPLTLVGGREHLTLEYRW